MTDNERRALVGIAPIVLIGRLIVLVRRGPEVEEEPNLWTLPCGVLKIGESMEAAIRDRVRTKSGLVVAPLCETLQQSYVGMYDDVGRSERFGNVAFSFLCKVVGGEMRAGPRLVDVQALDIGDVVGEQLRYQRHRWRLEPLVFHGRRLK